MASLDYIDVDLYGEETSAGNPKTYSGIEAVKNAFKNYLLSDPGDYLYYPSVGGAIAQILHKNMTATILNNLTMSIKRQIENDFSGIIINVLQFIPDYETGVLEFFISFSVNGEQIDTSLYFDQKITEAIKYEYTYIEYVGENLLNFCINKKPDMGSNTLGIDNSLNLFRWGEYVFQNFTPADEYFAEIYAICNSGI
jgi:hypothetical protein